jgi:hypothetical protein
MMNENSGPNAGIGSVNPVNLVYFQGDVICDFGVTVEIDVCILFLIIVGCYSFILVLDEMPEGEYLYEEWLGSLLNPVNWLLVFLLLKAKIVWPTVQYHLLKGRASKFLEEFSRRCHVLFVGRFGKNLSNYDGVLYPIDYFIKHFYDRYYPQECAEAFSTYRRVNPSLDLKCDHIDKFGTLNAVDFSDEELVRATNSLLSEIRSARGYREMLDEVRDSVHERRYDALYIDWTSAAGHPYDQGVKKRDVVADAVHQADGFFESEDCFQAYMSSHVWYTTGRAKLVERDSKDSGRLIVYSGYAYSLLVMLFIQPWSAFMNRTFEWCGVGMSWMHGGAAKFAEYFEANNGVAPPGFRYVTIDIKSWDAKVHPKYLHALETIYARMFKEAGIKPMLCHMFSVCFFDMVKAVILMPFGYMFQTFQGMKSGWPNTSNDNTAIHKIVINMIISRIGYFKHKLYGDDNFCLVPDHITDDILIAEYLRLGFQVGSIHSSRLLAEVDFLAKYVQYSGGQYFIFRPAVETHARLLMPEEFDPGWRDRPDAIICAERCIGHLFDNPFNKNVREVCYNLLIKLRDHYRIERIDVTPGMLKKHPWRQFHGLPDTIPVVPSIGFIEELYGVAPVPINIGWPSTPVLRRYDPAMKDANHILFDQGWSAVLNMVRAISRHMSKKGGKRLVREASPYVVPRSTYGTHAARLEFAMKWFGHMGGSKALDLGSHPGACAHTLLKAFAHVTCVSLMPDDDSQRQFCPYVFKDERVRVIEDDANTFSTTEFFDIIHDDVDVLGAKSMFIETSLARDALNRALRYSKNTYAYLLTIRAITPDLMNQMYEVYLAYGHFDIVKPYYSHPWKIEFMVEFKKKDRAFTMRKRDFIHSLYHFLNSGAGELIRWSEKIVHMVSDHVSGSDIDRNPMQYDIQFQYKIQQDWLIMPCHAVENCSLQKSIVVI